MPDIIEIVLKLLDCVFIAFAVRVIHLRPPGDPRLHQMPKMIERYLSLILFGALDPFRAWTNQAHVAFEDIPKLGQLIEPQPPQPAPSPCYARIILPRIRIGRLNCLLFRIAHEHCTELICRKSVTLAPDTRLLEDCLPAAIHPNHQENSRKEWRENQKENGRKEQIAKAFEIMIRRNTSQLE